LLIDEHYSRYLLEKYILLLWNNMVKSLRSRDKNKQEEEQPPPPPRLSQQDQKEQPPLQIRVSGDRFAHRSEAPVPHVTSPKRSRPDDQLDETNPSSSLSAIATKSAKKKTKTGKKVKIPKDYHISDLVAEMLAQLPPMDF
jgi:hypothetical protein